MTVAYRAAAIASTAVIGIVGAACTSNAIGSPTYKAPPAEMVVVGFDLHDTDSAEAGCSTPSLGYDDLGPGASVRITDEAGEIVGSGTVADDGFAVDSGVGWDDTCHWDISVEDVPTDRRQYSVEISDRGQVTFSKPEMVELDWRPEIEIGDAGD